MVRADVLSWVGREETVPELAVPPERVQLAMISQEITRQTSSSAASIPAVTRSSLSCHFAPAFMSFCCDFPDLVNTSFERNWLAYCGRVWSGWGTDASVCGYHSSRA